MMHRRRQPVKAYLGPRTPAERIGTVQRSEAALRLQDPALVVLVGPAGCGKSTFARRHFRASQVLSSDALREVVSDDPGDQSASQAAFSLLHRALEERVRRRLTTVVDATNLTRRGRRVFVELARRTGMHSVAVVFDLPLEHCQRRAAHRAERMVAPEVVEEQHTAFVRDRAAIAEEGFDRVIVLGPADLETPTTRPPAVVIDLDGTLTSSEWRVPLVSGRRRDWPGFFAGMGRDAPVVALVELAGWLAERVSVVILTGRPAEHEAVIRRWLAEHGVAHELLLMRRVGDRRPDTVVKRERYHRDIAPFYDVRLVIDDRPQVIEMWREEGLYVLTAVDPALAPLDLAPPAAGSEQRDASSRGSR